ncbi:EamA family transporter [Georgenia sunbinii]|uniref:EamA family transporter n=1 Tax=Georgenia sunbinii TaxID=3117728 RepID=UPI002F26B775
MGLLLALGSSAAYGLADFAGGVLSRRASFIAVALAGQVAGLALSVVVALALPARSPAAADLAWGALSGVGTGLAMLLLYRGLTRGTMSVVVPVAAVVGASLPVVVGVAVLGDRPSVPAWAGILAAVPAIWLVSRARSPGGSASSPGAADALLAGAFVALQYTALAQAGAAAGLWPIVAGRLAATLSILPIALHRRGHLRLPGEAAVKAAAIGGLATLALFLYLLATQAQLMTTAVILSSLYPVVPVILGVVVLRERLGRGQLVGLGAAAAAVVLIAVG